YQLFHRINVEDGYIRLQPARFVANESRQSAWIARGADDKVSYARGILAEGVINNWSDGFIEASDFHVAYYADYRDRRHLSSGINEPATDRIATGKNSIGHTLADHYNQGCVGILITFVDHTSGNQ